MRVAYPGRCVRCLVRSDGVVHNVHCTRCPRRNTEWRYLVENNKYRYEEDFIRIRLVRVSSRENNPDVIRILSEFDRLQDKFRYMRLWEGGLFMIS